MGNPKIHTTVESMEEGRLPIEVPTTSESQDRKTTKDGISTSTEQHYALHKEDGALDVTTCESLRRVMSLVPQTYIQPELDILNNMNEKFGKLETGNPLEIIESADPFIKMKVVVSPVDPNLVGWAETEVDATIEEIAAWEFNATSKGRMDDFTENGGRDRIISKLNDHSQSIKR